MSVWYKMFSLPNIHLRIPSFNTQQMPKYLLISACFLLAIMGILYASHCADYQLDKENRNQISHTIPFYNLESPTKFFELPAILKEISDLDFTKENEIMCVQDELGVIFTLNTTDATISHQYKFGLKGDYEGVCFLNDTLVYVLQSDGNLFEITHYKEDEKREIHKIGLYLSSFDHEGLCYDKKSNQLWVAAKSPPLRIGEEKKLRDIYSFDFKKRQLSDAPIFELDTRKLQEKAHKNGLPLFKAKEFRPSALAIHPITQDIYILSSANHTLLILSHKGKFKYLEGLNKKIFRQPEGITFAPNGDMWISNEGGNKSEGNLLKFEYLKK